MRSGVGNRISGVGGTVPIEEGWLVEEVGLLELGVAAGVEAVVLLEQGGGGGLFCTGSSWSFSQLVILFFRNDRLPGAAFLLLVTGEAASLTLELELGSIAFLSLLSDSMQGEAVLVGTEKQVLLTSVGDILLLLPHELSKEDTAGLFGKPV